MAKQKYSQDCIDTALKAMTHFTEQDVKDYLDDVFNTANSYQDVSGQAAIQRAIQEVDKQNLSDLFQRNMITARNAQKLTFMQRMIRDGKATLKNLIARDFKGKNLEHNIEATQHDVQSQLYREFHDDMSDEEADFVMDKKNNIDIARAIDGKESSDLAKRIAERHMKLVNKTQADLVSSDAMPLSHLNPDHQINVTHDHSKILSAGRSLQKAAMRVGKYTNDEAKAIWTKFIKSKLDLEKTFAKTDAVIPGGRGGLDHDKIQQILDRTFDNIINDRSNIFTRSSVMNDSEALKRRSRMFFQWKDTESWMHYNEKYGKGDYYSAVMSHTHTSGNRIGAARIFGDDAVKMYGNLRKAQEEVEHKSTSWYRDSELVLKQVMGIDKTAVSPGLANFMSNVRTLAGMARLVKVAALSIPDAANAASFASRWGYDYFSAWREHIGHIFNLFPNEERKYIAGQFESMFNHHMGYVGKYIDAHNVSNVVQKGATKFYKTVGINALDKGNKVSSMVVMARHLAGMSGKTLEELPEKLKFQLDKFNMTSQEWDLLRKKNQKGLFTLDNVDSLTNDDIKKLYNDSNKHLPLYDVKNALHRKVYAMFDVASENAVTTPGAYMQAMMMQGTRPGGIGGEAMRMIMQFKGFAFQFINRTLVQGFQDAHATQSKIAWATSLILGTLPLSIASEMFNNILDGKSTPIPFKDTNFADGIRQSIDLIQPNIGLFYSILDPRHENQDMITNLMGSPSSKLLSDVFSTIAATGMGAATLDKKQLKVAMRNAQKAATSIIPSSKIPIISPFTRQMMGQKSFLQPGQKQLYGK
jgi:hypothetical protein